MEVLHRIRQQATQQLDLIQRLLDVDRLEAGSIALVLETFRVADVMESLRDSVPASWCGDGVRLEWQVTDGQVEMHSDRSKVEMILRNLIHNALKYTRHGSVTVRAERPPGDDRLRFSVADTGEGIAAKDLAHIFEMYQQGSSGPPRGGGVGLGLHIVKRLTEALGGAVTVDSRPGAGTQFVVSLPLHAPAPPAAAAASS